MASWWVLLCFSLAAANPPPPDWSAGPSGSDSIAASDGSQAWRPSCNLSLTSGGHAALHHAVPTILEKSDRTVSKLVLNVEGIEIAY